MVKTEINGNPKVQCLVNTVDESELPSQALTVFAWSPKRHAVLSYPDGHSCLTPGAFVECCFPWVQLGPVLVGINPLVFQKELMVDSFPIPPYTQHHLFWMKTGLWCGWRWLVSLAPQFLLSHIIVFIFYCRHDLF